VRDDKTKPHDRRIRVLFLAWGYSIHAERRIRIFADDPAFDVMVASTHNYGFRNARNVSLLGEEEKKKIREEFMAGQEAARRKRLRGGLPGLLARIADGVRSYVSVASFLWRIGVRDAATIRSARNSLDVVLDVAIARADLRILKIAAAGFDPNVVFLQTLLYPCYLAFFLPERYPVVVTFWNGDVTFWSQWNGIDRAIKRQIVSHGVRRAAALTVNSEHARRCLMEIGAEADKIHMIRYPGVDLERFAPGSKREARRALGISAEKVVLCPRGIGAYLNSDVIVEAAVKVARAHPDTLFLFVSGAEGETGWENHVQRARESGISGCLRRDGHIPWETMPLYYRSADVVVSVSSRDSLPNCMLEAMACGVPLVMGDIPQIRDWVEDGVNGFLVPCRDPAALAERISKVLLAEPCEIEDWTGRAAALVREKCDGKVAGLEIRHLVGNAARESRGGTDGA